MSKNVRAEIVEFPEEQLARESVVPVFDQPEAVKKRYVPLGGRVELGVFAGATLSDSFFNSYPFGLNVNYHFSDFHAVNVERFFGVPYEKKPFYNAKKMSEKIIRLLKNPEKLKTAKIKAREFAVQNFDWKIIIEKHKQFLNETLN